MDRQGRDKDDFTAAYLRLPDDLFDEKIRALDETIRRCTLCPRACGIDRASGERGFCRTGDLPFVSSWGAHFGEERPLVGSHGSGTIFMGNCNLGCIFCQNYTISHLGEGEEISLERLAGLMIALQEAGCHNINFVTPTHQTPSIVKAVRIAADRGLRIPLVYNCGGYEALETVSLLEGIIDIYMPDFKYWEGKYAARYSAAEDYPEIAKAAIKEMHRQVGDLYIDDFGIAKRGLLIRHLVLPENMAGTEGVVRFIADEISKNAYVNIMDQYHPCFKASANPPLNRRITSKEYSTALESALKAGLKRIDGVTV